MEFIRKIKTVLNWNITATAASVAIDEYTIDIQLIDTHWILRICKHSTLIICQDQIESLEQAIVAAELWIALSITNSVWSV